MYYVGIDLGGTSIKACIIDEVANIIAHDNIPTNLPRNANEIINDLAVLALKLITNAGLSKSDIEWIGVGTPGTVDHETGMVIYANNLNFVDVPLKRKLEVMTGMHIFVENDANVAAYGEYLVGAAKGYESVASITIGTGIGSGVIIGGKNTNGVQIPFTEWGHTVIIFEGEQCSCGRKGCWEVYASATALIKMTREAMERDRNSIGWGFIENNISNISGKTAFDSMKAGDRTLTLVVEKYLAFLNCGLVNIINALQPQIICLGGGICNEGNYLIEHLTEHLDREYGNHLWESKTKLCISNLGEKAGLIGAALLGKR